MKPGRIEGCTRIPGQPVNWDEKQNGIVTGLPIRDEITPDGLLRMTSAWLPTTEELVAIAAGAPILLTIYGSTHPVVSVWTGDAPPPIEGLPPQGFKTLPPGVRCRCPKMWKHGDNYYCCQAGVR